MQDIMEFGKWEKSQESQKEIWKVSDHFGTGFLEHTRISPGIASYLHKRNFLKTNKAKVKSSDQSIGFYCCLNGFEKLRVDGGKKEILFTRGQSGIFIKGKGLSGIAETQPGNPYFIFSIEIDRDYFKVFNSEEFKGSLKVFNKIAQEEFTGYFNQPVNTTQKTMDIVQEIINCNYSPPMKQIYMEGKALELIANIMNAIHLENSQKNVLNSTLKPKDIERIYFARDLLLENLISPPGLFELAKITGMNHFKLNRGFKEVFGNTVFGYLRELRLKEAKRLLEKGEMNVTEVSLSVGYSCLSHFAKIFKEHYGVSPGRFLRQNYFC